MTQDQIVIFKAEDGTNQLQVKLQGDTIWLTQKQMALLFDKDTDTIGLHLKNIFQTKELDKKATTEKYSVVQIESEREVKRRLLHYSLDAIISVGYRVNSKRGTQFRIWATKVLKDYLVKGYAVNEKRLQEKSQQLTELKEIIALQEKIVSEYSLEPKETEGLIGVIASYSKALDMLDDYDHQRLQLPETGSREVFQIHYEQARKAIDELGRQTQFQGLFGREKDDSFKSSLSTIYQTFDGKDLYPTTEEKAANLLYFVVKNHSFTDGNKRIAAFLFVWFLDQNKLLINQDGKKRISDNALVALTLMIAESHPDAKDMMIKLVVNLLANNE